MPLCYIYSFAFDNHSTAQISIMTWNFMTGFVAVLAYFIMTNIDSTKALGETLVHLFRFFPPYNVGEGLINISANYYYNKILLRNTSYWAWEVAGRDIAFMGAEAVGYFLVVLLTESEYYLYVVHVIEKQRTNSILTSIYAAAAAAPTDTGTDTNDDKHGEDGGVDSDVAAEEVLCRDIYKNHNSSSIKSSSTPQSALLLVGIEKVYPPSVLGGTAKHAVRNFNLVCPEGERFGLLGMLYNPAHLVVPEYLLVYFLIVVFS